MPKPMSRSPGMQDCTRQSTHGTANAVGPWWNTAWEERKSADPPDRHSRAGYFRVAHRCRIQRHTAAEMASAPIADYAKERLRSPRNLAGAIQQSARVQ